MQNKRGQNDRKEIVRNSYQPRQIGMKTWQKVSLAIAGAAFASYLLYSFNTNVVEASETHYVPKVSKQELQKRPMTNGLENSEF